MKKTYIALLPLLGFFLLVGLLWRGLSLDPHKLPSALLDKPVPSFTLPNILVAGDDFSDADLNHPVAIVNVWATWCETCVAEHAFWMNIINTTNIPLYGIDYKDDKHRAQLWLSQYGNPYKKVGDDKQGTVAIDWGVYGTPETFIVDRHGLIRYKHIGAVSQAVWVETFLPIIRRLKEQV